MKTQQTLITLVLLLISSIGYSQTYIFEYDAAGNRIIRYQSASLMSTKSAAQDTTAAVISSASVDPEANATSGVESTPAEATPEPFRTVLYPNPTSGYLTLELPDLQNGENGSLSIVNVMGRMVYHQKKVNSIQSLDISSYPAGNYILRIIAGKNIVSLKIIKK